MSIKKSKEIEKQLSALEGIKVFFEDLKEKREEFFEGKSEKWQYESDHGIQYGDDNNILDSACDDLQSIFDSLTDLFETE